MPGIVRAASFAVTLSLASAVALVAESTPKQFTLQQVMSAPFNSDLVAAHAKNRRRGFQMSRGGATSGSLSLPVPAIHPARLQTIRTTVVRIFPGCNGHPTRIPSCTFAAAIRIMRKRCRPILRCCRKVSSRTCGWLRSTVAPRANLALAILPLSLPAETLWPGCWMGRYGFSI